jgi:uncharacterized membrane protein YjfL (UPF0719 family)
MLELVGQVLAYSGVGLAVLIAGFFVLDALTPGNLGKLVVDGNPNAAVLAAATLVSLGLVLWFAIFFTGAGWDGLDDALVYGAVGVGAQLVGFMLLDLLTPGKLGDVCMDVNPEMRRRRPASCPPPGSPARSSSRLRSSSARRSPERAVGPAFLGGRVGPRAQPVERAGGLEPAAGVPGVEADAVQLVGQPAPDPQLSDRRETAAERRDRDREAKLAGRGRAREPLVGGPSRRPRRVP